MTFGHYNALKSDAERIASLETTNRQLMTDVQRLLREQPPVSGNGGGGPSDASNDPFGGPRDGRTIVCKLKGPLYRTISVNSDVYEWNGSTFADTGRDVTIWGDLMRGYHFGETIVVADRLPNARYFCRTSGIFWIEGKLDAQLDLDSSALMSVYNEATDTGLNVTLYASKLMAAALDADIWVHGSWHEANQHWRHSGNEC